MNNQDIKATVENIIRNSKVGVMATVKGNRPHSRYMTFMNDNLTLYTPTSKETDKAEEVEANPYTHILLGYEGEGFGDSYVEYHGEVSIMDDAQMKEKIWNDQMKLYFDGPNDPNLIILQIKPNKIQLLNKKGEPPQTLEL